MVRRTISRRARHLAVLSLIGLFLALYALRAAQIPSGSWDAWAIWNLHAKFLAFADDPGAFRALGYSHPDYPPLVPLLVAAGWQLTGDTPLVPIIIHGTIYTALLWLMRDRQLWAFLMVGAIGLVYAPTQYADTLLATLFLCAVVAYCHGRYGWAGIALGLAALTKNEGLLMVAAFVAAWLVYRRSVPWRLLAAAMPLVALTFVYKHWIGVENDVLGAGGVWARATDVGRYLYISQKTTEMAWAWNNQALVLTAACVYVWGKWRASVPLMAVGLTLIGYLAIYAISPHSPDFHVTFSFHRLLWQLFPATVYLLSERK
jgi:hypothetical protein